MAKAKTQSDSVGVSFDYKDWLYYRNLQNGVLRFYGEITPNAVFSFLQELDESVRREFSGITIYLTSEGGYIYDAFAMYDAIKAVSRSGIKVTIIVEGWAASAAATIVLQAADERLCRPSSRFLLHEVSRWAFSEEKASALQDEVKEITALTNMILDVLSEKCNHSRKEIKQLIERKETWMSAEEAKEWGLIDRIL